MRTIFYEGVKLAFSATCEPSTCGPNSECKILDGNDTPICSCDKGFVGAPPNCKLECTLNKDCDIGFVCLRNTCRDPCPGLCGISAFCEVMDHIPICKCLENYYGNPYDRCKSESETENQMYIDPVVQNICETNPPACQ